MAAAPVRIVEGTPTGGAINVAARSTFEIGDRVVHPQYGVGQIVKLEDREFERGDIRRYYEIQIPGGSTVWVPVDLSNSGLRGLAHKNELAQCREILKSRPSPLMEDGRVRQSALVAHLKQGTIAAQCEVVRDLSAFVAHKPAYGTISSFLEAMLHVLSQEWAIVEGITTLEAMSEISSLLDKNP
ncbi:MAG TPA: CarD family transcriptional regulator [Anaerolineales bacterium]|nr:CarD family transcriptional regulator [Anaerolineales bacterium]